jgi:hypothetical protein
MFKNRCLRVFVVVVVILDLAAIGLAVGLHERAAAQASSAKRAERNDRFDFGVNTVQDAVLAWAEAHGHTWPTPADVTQDGLSPYLRGGTSWPVNPYDGRPMHQGTGRGDYRYRPTGAQTGTPVSAYTLTGTNPDGKPLSYLICEGAGPVRVSARPGTAMIEGYTTGSGGGQAGGGPTLLGSISLEGLVRWHGVTKWKGAYISVTDATRMFDASGVEVRRFDQYSYEGKVAYWRVVARRSGADWVALELQALVTWRDRSQLADLESPCRGVHLVAADYGEFNSMKR